MTTTKDKSQPPVTEPAGTGSAAPAEPPPTDMVPLDAIEFGYDDKNGRMVVVGLAGGAPYMLVEGAEEWVKLPYLKSTAKSGKL